MSHIHWSERRGADQLLLAGGILGPRPARNGPRVRACRRRALFLPPAPHLLPTRLASGWRPSPDFSPAGALHAWPAIRGACPAPPAAQPRATTRSSRPADTATPSGHPP